MKSFFNKPKWAATGSDIQNTTETDFYRRSEQTYSDIVAASLEAHKKPKTETKSPQEAEVKHERHSKRPRLSDEGEKKDAPTTPTTPLAEDRRFSEDGKPSRAPSDGPIVLEKTGHGQEGSQSRTPVTSASNTPSIKTPTNLLDRPIPSPSRQSHGHNIAEQKKELSGSKGYTTDDTSSLLRSNATTKSPSEPSKSPADDPVVQILITSEIPNTKPLLVQRKLTQGLREVRIEWCKRQEFTTEEQSSIHLTWKGRRLFDVTTCRSLGIKVESSSSFSDVYDDHDTVPQELRIHMEAVTENPALLNRAGSSPDGAQPSSAPPNHEDEQNEQMKLILRSPGWDDLKIKARPKTMISKLISVFRDKQNISADDEVFILFDGDRLEPGTCLGDHDIADLDMLDVQVKSRA